MQNFLEGEEAAETQPDDAVTNDRLDSEQNVTSGEGFSNNLASHLVASPHSRRGLPQQHRNIHEQIHNPDATEVHSEEIVPAPDNTEETNKECEPPSVEEVLFLMANYDNVPNLSAEQRSVIRSMRDADKRGQQEMTDSARDEDNRHPGEQSRRSRVPSNENSPQQTQTGSGLLFGDFEQPSSNHLDDFLNVELGPVQTSGEIQRRAALPSPSLQGDFRSPTPAPLHDTLQNTNTFLDHVGVPEASSPTRAGISETFVSVITEILSRNLTNPQPSSSVPNPTSTSAPRSGEIVTGSLVNNNAGGGTGTVPEAPEDSQYSQAQHVRTGGAEESVNLLSNSLVARNEVTGSLRSRRVGQLARFTGNDDNIQESNISEPQGSRAGPSAGEHDVEVFAPEDEQEVATGEDRNYTGNPGPFEEQTNQNELNDGETVNPDGNGDHHFSLWETRDRFPEPAIARGDHENRNMQPNSSQVNRDFSMSFLQGNPPGESHGQASSLPVLAPNSSAGHRSIMSQVHRDALNGTAQEEVGRSFREEIRALRLAGKTASDIYQMMKISRGSSLRCQMSSTEPVAQSMKILWNLREHNSLALSRVQEDLKQIEGITCIDRETLYHHLFRLLRGSFFHREESSHLAILDNLFASTPSHMLQEVSSAVIVACENVFTAGNLAELLLKVISFTNEASIVRMVAKEACNAYKPSEIETKTLRSFYEAINRHFNILQAEKPLSKMSRQYDTEIKAKKAEITSKGLQLPRRNYGKRRAYNAKLIVARESAMRASFISTRELMMDNNDAVFAYSEGVLEAAATICAKAHEKNRSRLKDLSERLASLEEYQGPNMDVIARRRQLVTETQRIRNMDVEEMESALLERVVVIVNSFQKSLTIEMLMKVCEAPFPARFVKIVEENSEELKRLKGGQWGSNCVTKGIGRLRDLVEREHDKYKKAEMLVQHKVNYLEACRELLQNDAGEEE